MIGNYKLPLISKMKPHQYIHVLYKSVGCFHNKRNLFIFKSNNTVRIYSFPSIYSTEKNLVGELTLSKNDIDSIDSLFIFYDNGNIMHGCTTVNTIEVKVMMFGFAIKKFRYVDESCNVRGLSLNALLHQLKS